MYRDADWRELSDGKMYSADDLVRTDTGGCLNCGKCCHGMRDTILLDPYDTEQLLREYGWNFQTLLSRGYISLGERDGLILPYLNMSGDGDACVFLDQHGRCRIHSARPGFCRLYPLGRYYRHDSRDFCYILQVGECIKPHLAKIRVRKWLGIKDLTAYERYICEWHYLLVDLEEYLQKAGSYELRRQMCVSLLQTFYFQPYDSSSDEEFFEKFSRRLAEERSRRELG